ncbi:RHS repeat-associated core domain-containing protein, partial [Streptococcus azizii]
TGNPYAYNGEARDSTGLDYLRARYYDSQAGTFLTEDSYSGSRSNPLSQNRYAYVQNNPVNYTDPSGHVRQSRRLKPARRRASQRTNLNLGTALGKTLAQIGNTVVSAAQSIMSHAVQEIQYTAQYVSALIQAPAEYRPMITNLWQQARAMRQSVYDWGTSLTREAQNIARNWTKALEETIRHVCDPKTTKAKDTKKGNVPSVADFRKLEEASKYGLTVEAKAKIDNMSMSDLKAKYGSVIGNYNTYTGTGYFNPLGSGENRAVIARYKQLKAEEEARIAASIAEMRKYHYTNIYKTIAETGLRPDGTPASQIEKDIAPYIPYLDAGLSSLQAITMTASAYVGYQNYYGKPVLGVDTTWSGKPRVPVTPRVVVKTNLGNEIDITP